MSLTNPLATTLSKVFSANSRPASEHAFAQLQNTYINRLNKEISKINDVRGDVAREHELKRDNNLLVSQIQLVQAYTYDNQSNLGKLAEAANLVADLAGIFGSDGDALDVTAQEVTDFTAKRDEVVEKLNSLYVLSFPNVVDLGVIEDLQTKAAELSSMVPDVGAVDPEGTDPANNNRQIADFVSDLVTRVSTAASVTEETVYLGNQMYTTFQEKFSNNEAELIEMTHIQQAKRTQEIEDLKVQYANLLKAVSLSMEVSQGFTEGLAKQLNGQGLPESGSILNLFT